MKPVRADFAPPWVPGRRLWFLLVLMTVLVLLAAAAVVHQGQALRDQRAALEAAQAERRAATSVTPTPPTPRPYEQSAREMLGQRQTAWPEMLTALEATAMVGVTPVSLEMSAGDGVARVEVSFSDYAKLLEYVEALNAGQEGMRWTLVQAQAQGGSSAVAVLHGRVSGR